MLQNIEETVNRVSTRMEILNNQLPRQITWQAGLFIEQRLGDVDLDALAARSVRVMTLVEEVPQLIETQRAEIFRQVDLQRADTLRQVEEIRDETLAEIDRQRIATIASLDTAHHGAAVTGLYGSGCPIGPLLRTRPVPASTSSDQPPHADREPPRPEPP